MIAILSDTEINQNNREQIKGLAVKSLIKRNIKESEINYIEANTLEDAANKAVKALGK